MVYPDTQGKIVEGSATTMAENAARLHEPGSTTWQGAGFTLLGVALGGLLIAAGHRVYALEGGVSTLAALLPVGYAFGAGMVATVNPCGILLVPSLVAYHLSQGEVTPLTGWQRAGKAALIGL